MRSGNPSLKKDTFEKHLGEANENRMTIQGTVNKTFLLLLLVMATSVVSWNMYASGSESVIPLMIGGVIGAFIIGMITVFVPKVSPYTAPLYALLEGLFIGAVSAHYDARFDGIVFQAALLTFGTLFALLLAYKSRLIKVTQNFRLGVVAATGAIAIVYLISIIGAFAGFEIPHLHEATPLGIIISLVIVAIAALNLVLDFDFIEGGAEMGAPKYMEWYGAFGLMVTLIWLYLEILRLLAKLRSSD